MACIYILSETNCGITKTIGFASTKSIAINMLEEWRDDIVILATSKGIHYDESRDYEDNALIDIVLVNPIDHAYLHLSGERVVLDEFL